MYFRGVVDFDFPDTVKEKINFFFVQKKDGRIRLVIDCRRSNQHFGPPEGVNLCTGETFAAMEMTDNEILYIGGVDLSDAFYHLELPLELRPYFSGPPGVLVLWVLLLCMANE